MACNEIFYGGFFVGQISCEIYRSEVLNTCTSMGQLLYMSLYFIPLRADLYSTSTYLIIDKLISKQSVVSSEI